MQSGWYIAVDLGGTKTAGALVHVKPAPLADTCTEIGQAEVSTTANVGGEILARAGAPTPAQAGAAAVVANVVDICRQLQAQADRLGVQVRAVGIGTAGVVDPAGRRITAATDAIRQWAGTELASLIHAATGLPAFCENDVHAHARGEAWLGAAKGASSALLIAVGTGVGGALVLAGKTVAGARGIAGHFGHFAVPEATGIPCTCGGVGHLEAIASGPAILATYQGQINLTDGQNPRPCGIADATDTREVVARAEAGEAWATAVVTGAAAATGRALGGLVNALDPAIALVGGGLAAAGPLWWGTVEAAFAAELLPLAADTPLRTAALGADAALFGAAALAATAILK